MQNDTNYQSYLTHVNHSRESQLFYFPNRQPYLSSDIKKYSDNLPVLNRGEFTEYLYSQFSNCQINEKKFVMILFFKGTLGLLDRCNRSKIIFEDYVKNNWRTFSFGTGSFSPSNMSGQLKYMSSIGIKPKIIIAFIDQTDYLTIQKDTGIKLKNIKMNPF